MSDRLHDRMREIRYRTAIRRRRRENGILSCLSALCLMLSAGIGIVLKQMQQPAGLASMTGGYSSVLLRDGAGAYVVVGIAAFIAGVGLTWFCFRLRK